MNNLNRWEGNRAQDQFGRIFSELFERTGQDSNLTTWAPAVDIYENEHELVVKADLPDVDPKDLDIRVENNILTIRGERKFEKKVERRQLPARRARVRLVQPQLLAGEHGELRMPSRPTTRMAC